MPHQRMKRKGLQLSSTQGWYQGRLDGYARGYQNGFHRGWYDAVMSQKPMEPIAKRPMKVVYITAGIDVPYPALDQAIIDTLGLLVEEVVVATPSEDVVPIVERIRPDLLLVLNGVVFSPEQVQAVRERGVPTAVWMTDDPYYTDWTVHIAPRYDFVFTLESSCVEWYRNLGCEEVHYLPFAANPNVYHPQEVEAAYHSDICFIGTAFWNRVQWIDSIAEYLADKNVFISGWWWDRLEHYHLLKDKIRLGDWMTPEETAKYYNGAKIVLNIHRDIHDDTINFNHEKLPAHSLNPRTFEIAGCGVLQLTDVRRDLEHFYQPGVEIATFRTREELIQLIDYYLTHEEERKQMGIRSFLKTQQQHLYIHRLETLLNTMKKT